MSASIDDQERVEQSIPIQEHQGFLVVSVQTDLSLAALDQFTEEMLARIHRSGARGVIMDLQEVSILDNAEFRRMGAIGAMARVMGAQLYITGLQPGVVAGLVQDDIDLSQYRTTRSVDDAMSIMSRSRLRRD